MEDRRKFFRFDAPLNIKYASDRDSAEGWSRTKNVSREGVAFAADTQLGKDQTLKMQFDIPGDNFPVIAQGTVIWVAKNKRNVFDVGVKLEAITRADRGRILEYSYQQWLKLKNIVRKDEHGSGETKRRAA
ncbi:MAG: PilZ domain-containing protein [Candidatus Omnitrophota bacterium]